MTLIFLASMELTKNHGPAMLPRPSRWIIDSFAHHITRGHRRNLAHSMLCHLANRMRIRIILTTNFDTLIEDAFAELGESLKGLPVSIEGTLPSARTVHGLNCCVKLHGELHEIRADNSLNRHPRKEDQETFFWYLHSPKTSRGPGFIPSHLLVCGYSGEDARCMEMIQNALKKSKKPEASSPLKLFWICHQDTDLEKLKENKWLKGLEDQVIITVNDRTDLLLYELYQRVTLSLPRGGFNYQFNHNYPAKIWSRGTKATKDNSNTVGNSASNQIIADKRGAMEHMLREFDLYQKEGECIWLELEDYADVFGLAHEVFQIISLRKGHYDLEQTSFIPFKKFPKSRAFPERSQWVDRISRIMDAWNLKGESYILFLYGRNGPGGCDGWQPSKNGKFWNSYDYKCFEIFVDALTELGFRIVYAPYDKNRQKTEDDHCKSFSEWKGVQKNTLEQVFPKIDPDPTDWEDKGWDKLLPKGEPKNSQWLRDLKKANNELFKNRELLPERFILAMTLFRQSRHYSALISEALIKCPNRFNTNCIDNDFSRSDILVYWLTKLRKVTREKRGGYVWFYRDMRQAFQFLAEERTHPRRTSGIHHDIGDWYFQAFCATGHVKPLQESLYHYFQSVMAAEKCDQEFNEDRRRGLAKAGMFALIKVMKMGRGSIRFWTDRRQAEAWFDFKSREGKELIKKLQTALDKIFARGEEPTKKWVAMFTDEASRHVSPRESFPENFIMLSEWPSWKKDPAINDLEGKLLMEGLNSWKKPYSIEDEGWRHWKKPIEKSIPELFKTIIEPLWLTLKNNPAAIQDDARELINYGRILARKTHSKKLLTAIKYLFEYSYILIKHAKLLERGELGKDAQERFGSLRLEKKWEKSEACRLWLWICLLSRLMLELCKFIDPNLWEQDYHLRICILRSYALALGRLGRFYEAHRRLNEAHAIRSKLPSKGSSRDFAIIKLRRAEIHLLEAALLRELLYVKNGKLNGEGVSSETLNHLNKRYGLNERLNADRINHIERIRIAKLDDAWLSLERAESFLRGHSHSSLWWGRLISLKMKLFAESSTKPWATDESNTESDQKPVTYQRIAFREKKDHSASLQELFRQGENCAGGRLYSVTRLVHFYEIATKRGEFQDSDNGPGFKQETNSTGPQNRLNFKEYLAIVKKGINDEFEKLPVDDLTRTYWHTLIEAGHLPSPQDPNPIEEMAISK